MRYAGSALQCKYNSQSIWNDVETVNPVAIFAAELIGTNQSGPNSQLELAISHDGGIIAVGGNDGSLLCIYIFERTGGNNWTQASEGIILVGANTEDSKITSMDMSSDALTIAIGVNRTDTPYSQGYVQIFTRNPDEGQQWIETQQINGSNVDSAFGTTVALSASGSYLAVCAAFEAGNGGRVHIFTRVVETYNLVTTLEQGTGYEPDTQFGKALAIVQNNFSGIVTVAVASPLYNAGVGRTSLFTNETGSYVEKVLTYIGISTGPAHDP
jgi:hypothetical protein